MTAVGKAMVPESSKESSISKIENAEFLASSKMENEKDLHILQSSYHTSSKQQQRNEGTSCHDGEFRLKLNVFKKYQEFKQQSSLIKKNGKDDEEESAMEINGNDEESEEREEVYGD